VLNSYFGIGAFSLWVGLGKRSHSCEWSPFHSHQDPATSSRKGARTSSGTARAAALTTLQPNTTIYSTSCRAPSQSTGYPNCL